MTFEHLQTVQSSTLQAPSVEEFRETDQHEIKIGLFNFLILNHQILLWFIYQWNQKQSPTLGGLSQINFNKIAR
jgi:hypothetical protein